MQQQAQSVKEIDGGIWLVDSNGTIVAEGFTLAEGEDEMPDNYALTSFETESGEPIYIRLG